jgi:serine/threonine protein kinase
VLVRAFCNVTQKDVFLAWRPEPTGKDLDEFREILSIRGSLRSPFVVRLLGSFEDAGRFWVVLEHAPYSSLVAHADVLCGAEFVTMRTTRVLTELIFALASLHAMGIVHDDLNRFNVLAHNHVRLGGVAFARPIASRVAPTAGL